MPDVTEEYIIQRLAAREDPLDTDGYAEIDLSPEIHLRNAAVLIPLARFQDEWHVLYTRRTDRVESHKGQVSFPGGAADEGETEPEQTALREANEEIGMKPGDVRILGRLNSMATVTNFRVRPIVGVIPWPYAFRVANFEVARVFTMPLLWLADKSNFWEFYMRDRDRAVIFYHPFDGELLWGATARMTVSFLRTLDILK